MPVNLTITVLSFVFFVSFLLTIILVRIVFTHSLKDLFYNARDEPLWREYNPLLETSDVRYVQLAITQNIATSWGFFIVFVILGLDSLTRPIDVIARRASLAWIMVFLTLSIFWTIGGLVFGKRKLSEMKPKKSHKLWYGMIKAIGMMTLLIHIILLYKLYKMNEFLQQNPNVSFIQTYFTVFV